jgi:ATP-dependent DNA ligase
MTHAPVYGNATLADIPAADFTGRIAQPKVDGWRAVYADGFVTFRNGGKRAISGIPNGCILDGELVGNVFHAFDLLTVGGVNIADCAQIDRLKELEKLDGDFIRVPWSTDCRAIARHAESEGFEGIVTKLARAPYGKGCWLRYKRSITVDAVVTVVDRQKQSAAILVAGNDAGRIFAVPAHVNAGDLIECEAMEFTKTGKLRHGRFLRVRQDLTHNKAR